MIKEQRKSWNYFTGARRKALAPLTPEQEKIRYRLWERWASQGKRLTVGRWNMASACARTLTAYPRDSHWAKRMRGYRGAAACKRKYADPTTGKLPFANGFYDPFKASAMAHEKRRAQREQKAREQTNEPLKHFIPPGAI